MVTLRCDGDSAEHVAFGGPIFYGHAASGYNEKPNHPDNIFWPVEPNTWTAAAILVTDDTLAGRTRTSGFFRSLGELEPVAPRRAIAS